MRKLLLAITVTAYSVSSWGQIKPSEAKHRDRLIISEALLFLDQYENDVIWRGSYDEGMFKSFFTDNASIVSDIPMVNSQEQVSVTNYVDDALEFVRSTSKVRLTPYSVVLNQSYGSNIESGSGKVTIDVFKEIQFRSPNKINGELIAYHDKLDQRFGLTYEYDVKNGFQFKIERIESNSNKGKYVIVSFQAKGTDNESLQERFGNVLVDSKEGLELSKSESFGVFTLNDYSASKGYKVYSENPIYFQKRKVSSGFKTEPGQDKYKSPQNISEISFRKRRISILPEVGYEVKNQDVSTNFNTTAGTRLESMDYSMALGLRLVSKPIGSLTLSVRGGSSNSSLQAQMDPFVTSSFETDDAGDSYKRILNISELRENAVLSRNFFATGLSAEWRWNRFELSTFSEMRYFLSGTFDYSTLGNARYSGLYGNEYFNIEISDPEYYGFGSYNIDLQKQIETMEGMSLITGLSIFYDLNRRSQLKFSTGFVQFIDPIFMTVDNLSFDSSEYQSVLELDPNIWLNTYRCSISINYFL